MRGLEISEASVYSPRPERQQPAGHSASSWLGVGRRLTRIGPRVHLASFMTRGNAPRLINLSLCNDSQGATRRCHRAVLLSIAERIRQQGGEASGRWHRGWTWLPTLAPFCFLRESGRFADQPASTNLPDSLLSGTEIGGVDRWGPREDSISPESAVSLLLPPGWRK